MGGGMMRFDGKVALVTGAGGGLGRDYALAFAKRGASVVVNDLGGGRAGDGGGQRMADKVVDEIRAAGGKAVANYDSVEHGPAIIKTAIDSFGRIDIVVNNAGILRDKSFANMTELDWDLIQKVHLKGSWSVSQAAWTHMKAHKFGRIINTSSNSGVYGNFGQANYSAAKMGLIGLTNTMAIEGAKYGIQVNAYIPTAGSRLTEDIMPPEMFAALRTDYSIPLVLFLAHDDCGDSGGVFEAAAGWFGQIQWYRSNGVAFGKDGATLEQVRDHWDQIKDMNGSRHFSNSAEVGMDLVEKLNVKTAGKQRPAKIQAKAHTGGSATDPALAKAHAFPVGEFSYTAKDAILYALGVGAETATDIRYLYEAESDFAVLPTFSVVSGLTATAGLGSAPGLHVDFAKLLHGEQYLELFKPFPSEGKIVSEARIVDVLDKGSGAAVLLDVTQKEAGNGDLLSRGQYSIFLRGEGGFGGARSSANEIKTLAPPSRSPDSTYSQKTSVDQPALYRQASGDYNPIHIDAQFAQMGGFKTPIMHGLCTLGFAVRHVLKTFAGNDAVQLKAVKARFSKPVLPGQTLCTEMWKEGRRVHFQTKVAETGEVAISGGFVDLHAGSAGDSGAAADAGGLNSALVFEELGKRAAAQPNVAKKVNAVYLWVITKDGKEAGRWTVDLKTPGGKVYKGDPKDGVKAGVTLTLDDDNMVKLVSGALNPQQAFMSGKLKLKGNIMLTQKLQALLKDQAKL